MRAMWGMCWWLAVGAQVSRSPAAEERWVDFAPEAEAVEGSPMDLRFLNEKLAGEHGFITVREGHFARSGDGEGVRFWAVNGPPHEVKEPAELRRVARGLAARGVNLVRIHGAVFDEAGEVDPAKVQQVIDIVEAMKLEGIYAHASIYFPLWFRPKADLAWLRGYDGKKNPFAALMFNPEFQAKYRAWWEALLRTPGGRSGRKLIEEPALMGVEVQNEDSFFFWTFNEQNIPDEQLRILERAFGKWLAQKYGSMEAAFAAWNGPVLKRDAPAEGRARFGTWRTSGRGVTRMPRNSWGRRKRSFTRARYGICGVSASRGWCAPAIGRRRARRF